MYQEPRQVSTLLTLNMQIRNTTLHLSVIDLDKKRAKRRRLASVHSKQNSLPLEKKKKKEMKTSFLLLDWASQCGALQYRVAENGLMVP